MVISSIFEDIGPPWNQHFKPPIDYGRVLNPLRFFLNLVPGHNYGVLRYFNLTIFSTNNQFTSFLKMKKKTDFKIFLEILWLFWPNIRLGFRHFLKVTLNKKCAHSLHIVSLHITGWLCRFKQRRRNTSFFVLFVLHLMSWMKLVRFKMHFVMKIMATKSYTKK